MAKDGYAIPAEVVLGIASPKRKRRRILLYVIPTVVIGVLATTFGLYVAHLHPLSKGQGWNFPGTDKGTFVGVDGISVDLKELPYRHLEELVFGMLIANDGRHGLTITGVDLPGWGLLEGLEARVEPKRTPRSIAGYAASMPFRPFKLAPDEQRMISIRARFNNCATVRETHISSMGIRYSVFGIRRSQQLPLYADLYVPRISDEHRGPSSVCPVAKDVGDGWLTGDFDVTVSLEPEYALIFHGRTGPAKNCVITVNQDITATVPRLAGGSVRWGRGYSGEGKTTVISARRFASAEGPWDPKEAPVRTVSLACKSYDGNYFSEQSDPLLFDVDETRPHALLDPSPPSSN